jgi:hypothetical protein
MPRNIESCNNNVIMIGALVAHEKQLTTVIEVVDEI